MMIQINNGLTVIIHKLSDTTVKAVNQNNCDKIKEWNKEGNLNQFMIKDNNLPKL